MTSRWRCIRIVSVFLISSFIYEQFAWAAPDVLPSAFSVRPAVPVFSDSVALIEGRASGLKDLSIYLIQDAHTNESAQTNIARITESLVREHGIRTVYLEAGTRDDSLTSFRPLASLAKRQAVGRSFVLQGELSGAEYTSLATDLPLRLFGVEDRALYLRGIENHAQVSRERERFRPMLYKMARASESLKSTVYNPILQEFDSLRQRHLAGSISLSAYFAGLLDIAQKNAVDIRYYPELSRMTDIWTVEKTVDFGAAQDEQLRALDALSAEDRKVVMDRMQLSVEKDPKDIKFLHAFISFLSDKSGGFDAFPQLKRYKAYLDILRAMDSSRAVTELEILEGELYRKLIRTAAEEELFHADESVRLLSRMSDLTLSPEEFVSYKRRFGARPAAALAGYFNRLIADSDTGYERAIFWEEAFDEFTRHAESFYELTLERDKKFVENILRDMSRTREKKAAFLMGGYHAPNMKRLLEEAGVAYVSIVPQVSKETNLKRYEKILLERSGLKAGPARAADGYMAIPAAEVEQVGARLTQMLRGQASLPATSAASLAPVPVVTAPRRAAILDFDDESADAGYASAAKLVGARLSDGGEKIVPDYTLIEALKDPYDRAYMRALYDKFVAQLTGAADAQEDLRIRVKENGEGNFVPTSLMSEADFLELGMTDFDGEIINAPRTAEYDTAAKNVVVLIRNQMDAGLGTGIDSATYKVKTLGLSGEDAKPGAKATDIHLYDGKIPVSIAELKLLQAFRQAQRFFRAVVYRPVVSPDSKVSYEKLLSNDPATAKPYLPDLKQNGGTTPRTYRQAAADEAPRLTIVPTNEMYVANKVPTIDAQTNRLTKERETTGGSHGQWGVRTPLDILDHDSPDDAYDYIEDWENGDGLNLAVDRHVAGWAAVNRVPIFMIFVEKTPIDIKGGIVGIQKIGDKKRVQIMERAQAVAAGQKDEFENIGLEGTGLGAPGRQAFNANINGYNRKLLKGILTDLRDIIGKEKLLQIIAPDLIKNAKKQMSGDIEKTFIQLEGAIGSSILNLDAFFRTSDDPRIMAILQKHNVHKGQLVHYVFVRNSERTRFFTPTKTSFDVWQQIMSDYYIFDTEAHRFRDARPGLVPADFDIAYDRPEGKYYASLQNVIDAMGRASTVDLKKLHLEGRVEGGVQSKIFMRDAVLKGEVSVINHSGKPVDLNDPKYDRLLNRADRNAPLVLEDISIVIDTNGKAWVNMVGARLAENALPENEALRQLGINFDPRFNHRAQQLMKKPVSQWSAEDRREYQNLIAEAGKAADWMNGWLKNSRYYADFKGNPAVLLSLEGIISAVEKGEGPRLNSYHGGLGVLFGEWIRAIAYLGGATTLDPASQAPEFTIFIPDYEFDARTSQITAYGYQQSGAKSVSRPENYGITYMRDPLNPQAPFETAVLLDRKDASVKVRYRLIQVGSIRIIMPSLDHDGNPWTTRRIFEQLYKGELSSRERFEQEWLAGMSAYEMRKKLGLPMTGPVHLNETATFPYVIALIRDTMEKGYSYDQALRIVGGQIIFFTHTLVSAGIDFFNDKSVPLGDYIRTFFENSSNPAVAAAAGDVANWMIHGKPNGFSGERSMIKFELHRVTGEMYRDTYSPLQFLVRLAHAYAGSVVAVSQLNAKKADEFFGPTEQGILTADEIRRTPTIGLTNGVDHLFWSDIRLLQAMNWIEADERLRTPENILNPSDPKARPLAEKFERGDHWAAYQAAGNVAVSDQELWKIRSEGKADAISVVRETVKSQYNREMLAIEDRLSRGIGAADKDLARLHVLRVRVAGWIGKENPEAWVSGWENRLGAEHESARHELFNSEYKNLLDTDLFLGVWARRIVTYKRMLFTVFGHYLPEIEDLFRDDMALSEIELQGIVDKFLQRDASPANPDGAFTDFVKLIVENNQQIVFAGKTFDRRGESSIALLHYAIEKLSQKYPVIQNRVIFLEGYDETRSQRLLRGDDTWINTPKRPLEASGTSGMKSMSPNTFASPDGDGWSAGGIEYGLTGYAKPVSGDLSKDHPDNWPAAEKARPDYATRRAQYLYQEARNFYDMMREQSELFYAARAYFSGDGTKQARASEWLDSIRRWIYFTALAYDIRGEFTGRIVPSFRPEDIPGGREVGIFDLYQKAIRNRSAVEAEYGARLSEPASASFLAQRDLSFKQIVERGADVIAILGNDQRATFEQAIRFYDAGVGKYILIEGGIGRLTPPLDAMAKANGIDVSALSSEAEKIQQILIRLAETLPGLNDRNRVLRDLRDPKIVLLEKTSRFTLENFANGRKVLIDNGIFNPAETARPLRLLYLQTPLYQQLRAKGMFEKVHGADVRNGALVGISYSPDYDYSTLDRATRDALIVGELFRLPVNMAKGDVLLEGGLAAIPDRIWREGLALFRSMTPAERLAMTPGLVESMENLRGSWPTPLAPEQYWPAVLQGLSPDADRFMRAILKSPALDTLAVRRLEVGLHTVTGGKVLEKAGLADNAAYQAALAETAAANGLVPVLDIVPGAATRTAALEVLRAGVAAKNAIVGFFVNEDTALEAARKGANILFAVTPLSDGLAAQIARDFPKVALSFEATLGTDSEQLIEAKLASYYDIVVLKPYRTGEKINVTPALTEGISLVHPGALVGLAGGVFEAQAPDVLKYPGNVFAAVGFNQVETVQGFTEQAKRYQAVASGARLAENEAAKIRDRIFRYEQILRRLDPEAKDPMVTPSVAAQNEALNRSVRNEREGARLVEGGPTRRAFTLAAAVTALGTTPSLNSPAVRMRELSMNALLLAASEAAKTTELDLPFTEQEKSDLVRIAVRAWLANPSDRDKILPLLHTAGLRFLKMDGVEGGLRIAVIAAGGTLQVLDTISNPKDHLSKINAANASANANTDKQSGRELVTLEKLAFQSAQLALPLGQKGPNVKGIENDLTVLAAETDPMVFNAKLTWQLSWSVAYARAMRRLEPSFKIYFDTAGLSETQQQWASAAIRGYASTGVIVLGNADAVEGVVLSGISAATAEKLRSQPAKPNRIYMKVEGIEKNSVESWTQFYQFGTWFGQEAAANFDGKAVVWNQIQPNSQRVQQALVYFNQHADPLRPITSGEDFLAMVSGRSPSLLSLHGWVIRSIMAELNALIAGARLNERAVGVAA